MEITTERLRIRSLTEADYIPFERTLNEVQKTCMGSGKAFFDWIVSQYAGMDIVNGLISLGIFDKATGELLGTAGAGRHDDLHEPEIFYYLLPEHRGKGFATEAVKEITEWALANYDIPYLIATASADNEKSQHVLERCGYELIDERALLVHVTGATYDFKYYRFYKDQEKTARRIAVIPYNPRWLEGFLRIKDEIAPALGGLALAIEHVGSTSVPGLWAKPIIDIDVVIRDETALPEVIMALAKIGYAHDGNLGIEGREAFSYADKAHLTPHHLYVCPAASPELRRHLMFRDYLRFHPEAAEEYGRVKRESAALFPHDIDAYISYKSAVIDRIYRAARIIPPGDI